MCVTDSDNRLWHHIKRLFRLFIAFTFSHIGVCGLVLAYIIFGAFLFQYVETNAVSTNALEIYRSRMETAERLLEAFMKTKGFDKGEFISLSEAEISNFTMKVVAAIIDGYEGSTADDDDIAHADSRDRDRQWSFSGAFLYSLTVITTIGYGNVAPRSSWGKMITIVYGIVGMPLFLLYLSNVGDILARGFKWTFARCCQCRWNCARPQPEEPEDDGLGLGEDVITVPISICLTVMVGYICGGGVWFSNTEGWSMLDASYFCFISLSTIGFGDLVPGTSVKARDLQDAIQLSFIFCSMYLLLGMALIAMCFNLMQEEVISKIRSCGRVIGCAD